MKKYEKLVKILKQEIDSGKRLSGSKLSGQDVIAQEYNVSVITSKRALNELQNMGYIERRPKSGSYVCDKIRHFNEIHIIIESNYNSDANWVQEFWRGVENQANTYGVKVFLSSQLPKDTSNIGVIFCGENEDLLNKVKTLKIPHIAGVIRSDKIKHQVYVNFEKITQELISAMQKDDAKNIHYFGNMEGHNHKIVGDEFIKIFGSNKAHQVDDNTIKDIFQSCLDSDNPMDAALVMGASLPICILRQYFKADKNLKLGIFTESQDLLLLKRYAYIGVYSLLEIGAKSFDLLHKLAIEELPPTIINCENSLLIMRDEEY